MSLIDRLGYFEGSRQVALFDVRLISCSCHGFDVYEYHSVIHLELHVFGLISTGVSNTALFVRKASASSKWIKTCTASKRLLNSEESCDKTKHYSGLQEEVKEDGVH